MKLKETAILTKGAMYLKNCVMSIPALCDVVIWDGRGHVGFLKEWPSPRTQICLFSTDRPHGTGTVRGLQSIQVQVRLSQYLLNERYSTTRVQTLILSIP